MKIFTSGIREKFGMIKFGFEVNRDFCTKKLRRILRNLRLLPRIAK